MTSRRSSAPDSLVVFSLYLGTERGISVVTIEQEYYCFLSIRAVARQSLGDLWIIYS